MIKAVSLNGWMNARDFKGARISIPLGEIVVTKGIPGLRSIPGLRWLFGGDRVTLTAKPEKKEYYSDKTYKETRRYVMQSAEDGFYRIGDRANLNGRNGIKVKTSKSYENPPAVEVSATASKTYAIRSADEFLSKVLRNLSDPSIEVIHKPWFGFKRYEPISA